MLAELKELSLKQSKPKNSRTAWKLTRNLSSHQSPHGAVIRPVLDLRAEAEKEMEIFLQISAVIKAGKEK
jgi:hypothetical protein